MSHLLCAFTLRTECKHQYYTYFGKTHWMVHEVVSILYVGIEAAIFDGQFVKK